MLTKQNLIEKIAKNCNITKKLTATVVNELFSVIKESLIKDKEIRVLGLGKFGTKVRNPFTTYDFKTKTMKMYSANRVPYFKAAPSLKKDVKEAK